MPIFGDDPILRLQIDVWEWVRRINAHAPAGGWLHSLAYVVLVGLTVAAWRVVQNTIAQQREHKRD